MTADGLSSKTAARCLLQVTTCQYQLSNAAQGQLLVAVQLQLWKANQLCQPTAG